MKQANQRGLGRRLPLELGSALDGWRLGNGPLCQRLATALTAPVERQDLLPGTKLPPERLLAGQLGVARTTVSAAYEVLERRGLVNRRQGRGTHVTGVDGTRVDVRAAGSSPCRCTRAGPMSGCSQRRSPRARCARFT